MSAKIVAILGLIALLSTSACAAASAPSFTSADRGVASEAAPRAPAPQAAAPAPAPGAAQAPKQAATGGAPASGAADQPQQNLPSIDTRMIIRTVTMTIAVGDVTDVFHKVEALAGEQKGYLSTS